MVHGINGNLAPLHLHVPEPKFRPVDKADFSDIIVPEVDAITRPDEHASPADIHGLAYGLVRVLGGDNRAVGSWTPGWMPTRCGPCCARCCYCVPLMTGCSGRSAKAKPAST